MRQFLLPNTLLRYIIPANKPHPAVTIELGGEAKTNCADKRYNNDFELNDAPKTLYVKEEGTLRL